MALSHSLGFPRIGRDRELYKALDFNWKGELDETGLQAVGRQLRAAHWQLQQEAGIELLPVGDFAWYDQVLTHALGALFCLISLFGSSLCGILFSCPAFIQLYCLLLFTS